MNNQSETCSIDRSLQKLEFEMDWNMERSMKIREKIREDIKKEKRRIRLQKGFVFSSSLALVTVFIILLTGHFNGNLHIFNLSTSKQGELYKLDDEKISELQTQLEQSHLIQFTSPSGRDITIHTQENEWGSLDNAIAAFMNHPKYPSLSYTTREITVANQRAVLQEPIADAKIGFYKLYVITKKYVYYVQFSVGKNDKGNREELLQITEQFNYENER